jgi:hypothetical protein
LPFAHSDRYIAQADAACLDLEELLGPITARLDERGKGRRVGTYDLEIGAL